MIYPMVIGACGFFLMGVAGIEAFWDWRFLPLALLGAVMFALSCGALCPRCKLNISKRPTIWRHSLTPIPKHCFRCGRDRKGVKPFQFLFKPEPWDGNYRDDGGGKPPEGGFPHMYGD
ncbi:MAG: hypothetical protein AAGC58_07920 [Asticcacaulis sp.]